MRGSTGDRSRIARANKPGESFADPKCSSPKEIETVLCIRALTFPGWEGVARGFVLQEETRDEP
jgi:hypothetical protein